MARAFPPVSASVISMALLVTPMIACQKSAEEEERARLRLEIDQLRAQLDRMEAQLAKRSAEPPVVEAPALELKPGSSDKVLVVTPAGVSMDGKTLSAAELDATLGEVAAKQPDAGLVVRAEEGASHQHVVELLDRAKAAGVYRFALATPAEPDPAD